MQAKELGFYAVDSEKPLEIFFFFRGRGIDICKAEFKKISLESVGRLD